MQRAAKEFEGILVRQLLQATKAMGKGAQGGYGAMALDAMSSAVTDGGGLGLSRRLEEALSGTLAHHHAPAANAASRAPAVATPVTMSPESLELLTKQSETKSP